MKNSDTIARSSALAKFHRKISLIAGAFTLAFAIYTYYNTAEATGKFSTLVYLALVVVYWYCMLVNLHLQISYSSIIVTKSSLFPENDKIEITKLRKYTRNTLVLWVVLLELYIGTVILTENLPVALTALICNGILYLIFLIYNGINYKSFRKSFDS